MRVSANPWIEFISERKTNRTIQTIDSSDFIIYKHFFSNALTSNFYSDAYYVVIYSLPLNRTQQIIRAARRVIYDLCVCAHIYAFDLRLYYALLNFSLSRLRFGINTIEITPHKSIDSKHSEQVQEVEEEHIIPNSVLFQLRHYTL